MPTVVIAGCNGVVGQSVIEYYSKLGNWKIIGLSRREPILADKIDWVQVDLIDQNDCHNKLSKLKDVDYLVYCAVNEQSNVTAGWITAEHAEVNKQMLVNCATELTNASPNLKNIALLQGTKAYGGHLGPFKQPARESDDRYMGPNFYYEQMDWLEPFAKDKGISWVIFRPQIICGVSLGSPLNIITAIGVFASISREYGIPLRFPGGEFRMGEATDARLIAKAIDWAYNNKNAKNQVFNIHNGDVYTWETVWPLIADIFNMKLGKAHPFSLARVMPQNEKIWETVKKKHNLMDIPYNYIVPSWQFADFILGYGQRPNTHHMSTIKLRKAGFHDCIDTEEMFVELVHELQNRNVLPK